MCSDNARPTQPQKLRGASFRNSDGALLGSIIWPLDGARCFQARLESWSEGGLAAGLRKHMPSSSPRFDEKNLKNERNEGSAIFKDLDSTVHG